MFTRSPVQNFETCLVFSVKVCKYLLHLQVGWQLLICYQCLPLYDILATVHLERISLWNGCHSCFIVSKLYIRLSARRPVILRSSSVSPAKFLNSHLSYVTAAFLHTISNSLFNNHRSITVAARSKAWTVFARSDASRSQWPSGLRHELSSPGRTLGSCVRDVCVCVR
jgi:hypothetical protein